MTSQHKKIYYFFYPTILLAGVFLFVSSTLRPSLPSADAPQILYPSPHTYNLKTIVSIALKSAQESIYLSTYTLSDSVIIKQLNKKAAQGISIELLADKKNNPHLRSKLHPSIKLTLEKGKGLMHEKILVIDSSSIYLGTANMSYSSLVIHDNLLLGLYDPLLATSFLNNKGTRGTEVSGTESHLYLLPDSSGSHLKTLQSMLNTAKKTAQVALFTFTHPALGKTLSELAQKGVHVECAIDKNTYKGGSRSLLSTLSSSGIRVYSSSQRKLLHHKWALIDGEILIIGSANWTKAAFTKNKDYFIKINLTKSNRKVINNYWKDLVYLCNSD